MSENSGNGAFGGGWHDDPLGKPMKSLAKPATPPADADLEPDAEDGNASEEL
ncbi:hypothetical protein [Actinomadura sp. DC4]|uniref:hypothetical protein n=1 Tax=Actinomadura sp. DC4 TaxID=3055069 RepID=UPI0025B0C84A|nr:hypothetical protein [Actinomadura sp. DC4]MDN3357795.1 hypothetical protein [Actinomadura sp. DC4]